MDTRRKHRVAAGMLGWHTHLVFEVWVCTHSNEVSHNFRVEFAGVRGLVKRSLSNKQKKKKKIENRDWRK
jgi:hypothetical protein